MKLVSFTPERFDEFATKHNLRNIYQTSSYAKLMRAAGWDVQFIGIEDDSSSTLGLMLIIYKTIFMNYKVAYAPRGILFDYSNSFFVQELAKKLKEVLGKQKFMFLRMDPLIVQNIRDKKGNVINNSGLVGIAKENLRAAGFMHKGDNLFFENEKSRFEGITLLDRDNKELFRSFEKRVRYKINKAIASGIYVFEDTERDVKALYEFIQRKRYRSLTYYQNIVRAYGEKAHIYYANLSTENFVIEIKKDYENEFNRNNRLAEKIQDVSISPRQKRKILNNKMESDKILNVYKEQLVWATKLLQLFPNGLTIGGALTIDYDNARYLIIDGFNKDFKKLNPSYILKWQAIFDANRLGYKYFNHNAMSGDFNKKSPLKGLNDVKNGFNTKITEYIGEYDLILNNFAYNLYMSVTKDQDYKFSKYNDPNPKNKKK